MAQGSSEGGSKYLTARFQIGSCKGPLSYGGAETVFHPDDATAGAVFLARTRELICSSRDERRRFDDDDDDNDQDFKFAQVPETKKQNRTETNAWKRGGVAPGDKALWNQSSITAALAHRPAPLKTTYATRKKFSRCGHVELDAFLIRPAVKTPKEGSFHIIVSCRRRWPRGETPRAKEIRGCVLSANSTPESDFFEFPAQVPADARQLRVRPAKHARPRGVFPRTFCLAGVVVPQRAYDFSEARASRACASLCRYQYNLRAEQLPPKNVEHIPTAGKFKIDVTPGVQRRGARFRIGV